MRVLSLRAENVKRLECVELEIGADGHLIEVTGENAQGKTSLLDSIFYALAGTRAIPSTPIRRGEDHASVDLDLGDLKVRRTFNAQDDGTYTTTVACTTKDGLRLQKPQQVLDALLGEYTFDPLAFTSEKAAKQVDLLKRFVPDFDFAADKLAFDSDYAKRTDVNREHSRLKAEAAAILVPADAPAELVDEAGVLAELRGAGDKNRALDQERGARANEQAAIERIGAEAARKFDQADQLRRQAKVLDAEAAGMTEDVTARSEALSALPALGDPVDTAELAARLQAIQAANAACRQRQRRKEVEDRAAAQEAESKRLTAALEAREQARQAVVANAKMPVAGLGFTDGEVTLNGLPFTQASAAEQLRASVAIAAALNPKLRIAFVRDASRLDRRSWAALGEYAREHDLQIFAESVESTRPSAVVLHAGRRVSQPQLLAAE